MALNTIQILLKSIADITGFDRINTEAGRLQERFDAIDPPGQQVAELTEEVRELGDVAEASEFDELFADVGSVDEFNKRLESAKKKLLEVRDAKIAAGDESGSIAAADKIQALERLDSKLFGVESSLKEVGAQTGILDKLMSSTFNKLGFTMFITLNTFNSLVNIVRSFNKLIQEGARQIELFQAASIAAEGLGTSFEVVNDELSTASGNYITQNELLANYIELANAGNGELAESATLIAEVAAATSKLSGNTDNAGAIQKELTDALINGNAAVIDSTLGLLDLTGAEIDMELAAIRVDRALTDLEKRDIVLAEIAKQAQPLIEAAKDIEGGADNIDAFAEKTKQSLNEVKSDFSTLADAAAGALTSLDIGGLDLIISSVPGLRDTIDAIGDMATALEDPAVPAQELADILNNLPLGVRMAIELTGGAHALDLIDQLADRLVDYTDNVDNATASTADFNSELRDLDIAGPFRDFDATAFTEQLEFLLSDERQFFKDRNKLREQGNEQLQDLFDKEADQLAELEENKQDRILEIQESAQDKQEDAASEHVKRMLDLQDDLNEKLIDIEDDLSIKIGDIQEDTNDKRADAQKKTAKKLEDIEENHQKKLDAIRRKFELSRLKALIDRDARGLFEAERRRDEALRKEQERAKTSKENAKDTLEDKLKDIDDAEEKRIRRARRAAERAAQDAQERFEKAQQDELDRFEEQTKSIEKELEKQTTKIEKQFLKRRKKIIKQFDKQEQDFRDSLAEQFNDLHESFNDQQELIAAQAALQTELRLAELILQSDDLDQQLSIDELRWQNYWDFVNRQGGNLGGGPPGPPGGGTGGDPPPPDGGGGCTPGDAPLVFGEGGLCFGTNPNEIFCPSDGSKWACQNGQWRQLSGPTSSSASVQTTGTTSGAPGLVSGTTGGVQGSQLVQSNGGGPIPVVITVQNDKTLEQILKEISYSAVIEVIE